MFGRRQNGNGSNEVDIDPTLGLSETLGRLLGNWEGNLLLPEKSGRLVGHGSASARYHPSPDGWHIVEYNTRIVDRERVDGFSVIALAPNTPEISITKFVPGGSDCTIYEVVGLKREEGDATSLTLQTMGWQGKKPCEVRLTYKVSGRSLQIARSNRLTTNTGRFLESERLDLSKIGR